MGFLDKIFPPKADFGAMIQNGAAIVDVRSPQEYSSGHVAGSVNIPLDQVKNRMSKFKKMEGPVILCCASGMRSGRATSMLKGEGIDAHNGGSWGSLRQYV